MLHSGQKETIDINVRARRLGGFYHSNKTLKIICEDNGVLEEYEQTTDIDGYAHFTLIADDRAKIYLAVGDKKLRRIPLKEDANMEVFVDA